MKNNNTFKHYTKQINSGKEPPILKGILRAPLDRERHVSCLHAMPMTTIVSQVESNEVITGRNCGSDCCELTNSVTTIQATHTGKHRT